MSHIEEIKIKENSNKNLKQILGAIIIIYFILIAWSNTYQIGCFSLIIPILITLIIASSYIEIKLKQKECFRNCYFKENTIISRILMSPYLTSMFFVLLSISYTITLMYDILSFRMEFYFIIGIFIFAVYKIYKFLLNFFSGIVNDKHLQIFAREVTSKISSFILFCVYTVIFINGYEPEYLKSTLEETLTFVTNSISSECSYIDFVLRIKIEIEAHMWFYMKELDNLASDKNVKKLAWIGFIIFNALSILGLNRLIIQVVYLVNKILKDEDGK